MNSLKIHHISLNVADLQEANDFYTKVLHLTPIPRPELGFPGVWLSMGQQQLHLIEKQDHQAPAGQHFAFYVEDLHLTRGELMEKGIQVSAPREINKVCVQCFFKDPSGNLLELNQPL